MSIGTFLVWAAVAIVAAVLVLGLKNMVMAGPGSKSNKLMRLRVILQALAILVIFLVAMASQS